MDPSSMCIDVDFRMQPRSRIGTWDSDSGCSDISTVSAISDASDTSFGSRSTMKRRCSTPEAVNQNLRYSHAGHMNDVDARGADDAATAVGEVGFNAIHNLSALAKTYPSRSGGLKLVILRQPEAHHRARYQKEGSRGCIKDRTGNTCPALQLTGFHGTGLLQAFIATESGKVKPHHLYRACRVGGKHSTPCREHMVENVNVLEMDIFPNQSGIVNVDCLGILKLRNADLDHAAETDNRRKKKTPQVRIAFRAIVPGENGHVRTLQVVSTPICCTPSPGMPEIHRTSHFEFPMTGGEVIVIGRNFVKDETKLFVAEFTDNDEIMWEAEVPMTREYFHAVHLVATLPSYRDADSTRVINVSLIVRNKNKTSEPYAIKYVPKSYSEAKCASEDGNSFPSRLPSVSSTCTSSAIEQSMSSAMASVAAYGASSNHTISPKLLPHRKNSGPGYQNVGCSYCIQAPETANLVVISVPRSSPIADNHLPPTVQAVQPRDCSPHPHMQQVHGCIKPDVDRWQYENEYKGISAENGNMMMNENDMLEATDEELFNQILRDIFDLPDRV